MAALDYYVSLESDIFVPTYDVNMAGVFEGDRSRSIEDSDSLTFMNYLSNSSSQEDSPRRNKGLLMVLGSPPVLGSNTSNTWIPTTAKTKTTQLRTFSLAFEASLDYFWSKLPS